MLTIQHIQKARDFYERSDRIIREMVENSRRLMRLDRYDDIGNSLGKIIFTKFGLGSTCHYAGSR